MRRNRIFDTDIRTHRLGAYDDAAAEHTDSTDNGDELVIPENLGELADDDLVELNNRAVSAFQAMYGTDGADLTDDDLTVLSSLTEGIESISQEMGVREQARAERAEKASQLASRVIPAADSDEDDAEGELSSKGDNSAKDDNADDDETDDSDDTDDTDDADTADSADNDQAAQSVAASAGQPQVHQRREVRVDASRFQNRHLPKAKKNAEPSMRDHVYAAGEGSGYAAGTGIDWNDAGSIVDRRLAGFNQNQYASAARMGRHMRQQMGVMSIRKPIGADLMIDSTDPLHTEEVLRRATDERQLEGNSLVASGGWCAPSDVVYDLLELESRDGIFSLPEVGVTRGGITRTLGPNFADIYNAITGFHYTEQEDIDANYDGEGGGSKPCYKVDCPEFEEYRLEVDGLCITAGLLQQRGYPEMIARTLRGALVAHDHRLAARSLNAIESRSTSIRFDAPSATASILTAIELQVEHMRATSRMSRGASIEGVFPFWVRGAIRSDLSRRNGVDLLSVTDQQINGWFSQRGIAPQFVYNWQDLNTVAATSTTGWPASLKFLLYPAGTWVRGTSDIITVDTLFDSTQLGVNDYTALFTEEGWLVMPMGYDSRVIEVALDPDGVTGAQADLNVPSISLPAYGAPAVSQETITEQAASGQAQAAKGSTTTTTTSK